MHRSEPTRSAVYAELLSQSLDHAERALSAFRADTAAQLAVVAAATLLVETFERKGRVFSCGNGGSMCDAMHFAEELTGRYRGDRPALGATAISDPGHLSCVGNDYGYQHGFARYLEGCGRAGDCLLAISTSGSSANVLEAARAAREIGMSVIALTGKRDAALGQVADVHIATPAGRYADRVQELHIKVLHILIELVEAGLYGIRHTDV